MKGAWGMTEPRKNENELAMPTTTDEGRDDPTDGGALSPSMRQLILSFGKERSWDPDAYTRQRPAA